MAGFDPAKAANPTERNILLRAAAQADAYEARIQNQIASINRLIENKGWSYDDEMKELHVQLSDTQARLKAILYTLADSSMPSDLARVQRIKELASGNDEG